MREARFKQLKEKVLGKSYNLSLVFATDSLMRRLNKQYRKKDKTSNVLSFALEKNSGEIFINTGHAQKEAKKYKINEGDYLDYLFVHSLLHLKGYDHGAEMDNQQKKILDFSF